MNSAPPPSPAVPPARRRPGPPRSTRVEPGPRRFDDVVLGFVEYALAALLGFSLFLTPILGVLSGADSTEVTAADTAETSVASLFVLTLGFQILQGGYPWVYSRRRDSTIARDWGFVAKLPADIGFGALMAVACLVGAQLATVGAATLVGLDDTDAASNTGILTDNQGSPWLIGVILLVVVGAPLVEELLFRGLVLRTLERWFGSVAAVILSSLLFAIPHWQPDSSWQEAFVLLSALAVVGLVLAIGTVKTGRLGPAVIAHFIFNATGTLITLL